MTQCRSCGKQIYWGKTPAGNPCPFDDESHTISHFTTCPDANQWSNMTQEKGKLYTGTLDLRQTALQSSEDLKNHLWKYAVDDNGNPITQYEAIEVTIRILRNLTDILTPQQITKVVDEVRSNAHH